MSLIFTNSPKLQSIPRHLLVQKMLEENNFLIKAIKSYQNRGRSIEVHQLFQVLHRNIIILGSIADEISSESSADILDSSNSSDEVTSPECDNEAQHNQQTIQQ